jgi:hypothetical protein
MGLLFIPQMIYEYGEPRWNDSDVLKVIKIHRTPFFGWEVKPEVPYCKILWHVKDTLTYQRY